ncbi:MAG: hypothetical protein HQ515_15225 [Phycisphaeraceae bacterium]|nr:hypothetical protein [Phycisphaeraceae bacterium]
MNRECFKKNLPGADIQFQPQDMAEYENDAWDIRISLGSGPLEEAYYCTVEDPKAKDATLQDLLDRYALNPEQREQLDVAEYPELPFLFDELLQYQTNASQGLLDLSFYVNHSPGPGPVNLNGRARQYLCACTHHDQSHDYLVLDLVLVAKVAQINDTHLSQKQRTYGDLFLLFLLDHHDQRGARAFQKFIAKGPFGDCYDVAVSHDFSALRHTLDTLERSHFIKVTRPYGSESVSFSLEFTEQGRTEIARLTEEVEQACVRYDVYDSVSVWPCALGVPDGFDARIQMMEYDEVDYERQVFLLVLLENKTDLITGKGWYDHFLPFDFYETVQAALAYRTNFSGEVLCALKELAQ